MASNIGLPKGFEVEYEPTGLPEGFEVVQEPIKKRIDLTPNRLYKKAVSYPAAGLRSLVKGEDFNTARQNVLDTYDKVKPLGGVTDVAFDTAIYSRLPMLKGASTAGKIGAFGGNAIIQGGLPGMIEGLKQGDALGGAKTGANIALGMQILPYVNSLPFVNRVTKPIAQFGGWAFKNSFPGLKPKTVEQLIKPNSKALDLTEDTAQNLLMDTTERVQNTYDDLLRQRGQEVGEVAKGLNDTGARINVNDLAGDITETFNKYQGDVVNPARNMTGTLEDDLIEFVMSGADEAGTVSPVDLNKLKQQVGHMTNWADAVANNYQNPILEQIYGKWGNRLNDLSPELAQANARYAQLRNFQKNEGLKRILKLGDNVDTASSALRNYNNTVTKGNTSRNIQDLEKLFIKEGKQPFLNDVDDVNAANELLKTVENGMNPLGLTDKLKNIIEKPILLGAREYNRFREPINSELSKILTTTLLQMPYDE